MTEPTVQVTQADRERAKRVLYLAHVSHDIVSSFKDAGILTCKCGFKGCQVDYETHRIAMTVECVALELAKMRQQGDEAVAAVVEECAGQCDAVAVGHTNPEVVAMVKTLAKAIRTLKPNAQQILAERDKRVKEEVRKEICFCNCHTETGAELGMKEHEDCSVCMKELIDEAEFFRCKEIEARMREPMECGHPEACLIDWTPPNSRVFRGDGVEERLVNCSACAQQRELREALEAFLECPSNIDEATVPKGAAPADYPEQVVTNLSVGFHKILAARRALGEKE